MMKYAGLLTWGLGGLVLGWLGCSDAPVEGAVAARSQGLSLRTREVEVPAEDGAGAETAQSEEASREPAPEAEPESQPDEGSEGDPDNCNCIFFPPAESASCPADRLFCNSALSCRCQPERPAGAAQSAAASLAPVRAAQSRRLITDAHGSGEQLATLPPPPLPCVCLGGTPSPPEGGCPEEDWYCNRSGRCQCDS